MFSVIDQVLLRPLPYANASRLIRIGRVDPVQTTGFGSMSLPDLQDIAARSHSLQGVGFYTFQIPTLAADRPSRRSLRRLFPAPTFLT